MLFSATGAPANVAATTSVDIQTIAPVETTVKAETINVKEYVKSYFKDKPILAEIARCESTYRQFGTEGKVLRGKVNSADVGVMQINEKYHAARAKKLGIDLYSLDGNLQYGVLLYKEQGATPWNSSSPCWGKSLE